MSELERPRRRRRILRKKKVPKDDFEEAKAELLEEEAPAPPVLLPDFPDTALRDPSTGKALPPKIQLAAWDGYWQPGWEIGHYVLHAPKVKGWECIILWGIKGSFKSNREAWLAWIPYRNWDNVWDSFVMIPEEFTELVRQPGRIPVLVWDDVAAWLDSAMYFDNRDLYLKIKRYWQLLRTKISVFICSAPHKGKIAGFIIDDITSEMHCSPRSIYNYNRWAWQMNYKDPRKVNMFPVLIENRRRFRYDTLELPKVFNDEAQHWEPNPDGPYLFPKSEWDRYWARRLELADRSRDNLAQVMEEAFTDEPSLEEIRESAAVNMDAQDYKSLTKAMARVLGYRGSSKDAPPEVWNAFWAEVKKAMNSA